MEAWAKGAYLGKTNEETAVLNAVALKQTDILDELLRLESEDME